jgi:hypothetical protein
MIYTEEDLSEILDLMDIVLNNATGKFAPFAKTYAHASYGALIEYGERGLQMQIPYVLSNLQGWRGDLARDTKLKLKSFLP